MYEEMKERDTENLNAIENQSKIIENLQVKYMFLSPIPFHIIVYSKRRNDCRELWLNRA
jgi:hypothetical protein